MSYMIFVTYNPTLVDGDHLFGPLSCKEQAEEIVILLAKRPSVISATIRPLSSVGANNERQIQAQKVQG